ncbi:MAG TPA: nucleotide exchange factor GrpE [Limnochordales bacterium]
MPRKKDDPTTKPIQPEAPADGAAAETEAPAAEQAVAAAAGAEAAVQQEASPRPDGETAPAQDGAERPQEAAGPTSPELDQLQARIAQLEARERELADQYVRLLAEFDNYRRRTRQEMEALRLTAAERLIVDVLPVMDGLDQALAAAGEEAASPLGQGVRLIRQQLADVLARHGLVPIEAVGQPFDPNTMEAVAEAEPGDGAPAGYVVEEYRRGYRLHNKVVRPSLVKVAVAR